MDTPVTRTKTISPCMPMTKAATSLLNQLLAFAQYASFAFIAYFPLVRFQQRLRLTNRIQTLGLWRQRSAHGTMAN